MHSIRATGIASQEEFAIKEIFCRSQAWGVPMLVARKFCRGQVELKNALFEGNILARWADGRAATSPTQPVLLLKARRKFSNSRRPGAVLFTACM